MNRKRDNSFAQVRVTSLGKERKRVSLPSPVSEARHWYRRTPLWMSHGWRNLRGHYMFKYAIGLSDRIILAVMIMSSSALGNPLGFGWFSPVFWWLVIGVWLIYTTSDQKNYLSPLVSVFLLGVVVDFTLSIPIGATSLAYVMLAMVCRVIHDQSVAKLWWLEWLLITTTSMPYLLWLFVLNAASGSAYSVFAVSDYDAAKLLVIASVMVLAVSSYPLLRLTIRAFLRILP